MSRFVVLSVASSLAVALACSSGKDESLFGSTSASGGQSGAPSDSAAGGDPSTSTGGALASGTGGVAPGAGGTSAGAGGDAGPGGAQASGGTTATDAGLVDGGVATGGTGGTGGATGTGGVSDGAWAKCTKDADCTGGRVCTQASQSIIVSGRPGACVHKCPITSGIASCDPGLPGGTVSCTQLLVTSYCSISCLAGSNGCPAAMDCVAGYCFYSN